MDIVEVAVKSAWWSKINWTQFVSLAGSVLVFFGLDISEEHKAAIIAILNGLSSVLTIILRTWFTSSVTPAVANKI